jgi:uncharacterized protein YuzE
MMHGDTFATYDPEADAAYFKVKKAKVARTIQLQNWLLADVDRKGGLIGVEMLFVSKRLHAQHLLRDWGRVPVAA